MKPLSNIRKVAVLAICAAFALASFVATLAPAATPNIAVGAGQVVVIPLHLTGSIAATTAGVAKFNMPFPCRMIGVGAGPRTLTGSSNTLDVKLGGVTILSAPIAMTTGTYTEGVITVPTITDEGVITVDVTIPAGTLVDTTVFMTCVRR